MVKKFDDWRPLTKSGRKPKFNELERLVPIAQRLRDHRSWVEDSTKRLTEEFGPWYRGYDTSWATLEAALVWAVEFSASFPGEVPGPFIVSVSDVLADRAALQSEAEAVQVKLAALEEVLKEVESWFPEAAPTRVVLKGRVAASFSSLGLLCEKLADSIDGLSAWTRLSSAVESCAEAGVADPVEILRTAILRADDYVGALEKRVISLWLDHWFSLVPVLREFEETSHAHYIEEFRRLDIDLTTAARRTLASRLANGVRIHPQHQSI